MSSLITAANLSGLRPGTVLRVSRGLYDHVALLGEHGAWGRPVLSYGPTQLQEMDFNAFSRGSPVYADGYLGTLAPDAVLNRARLAGQRAYSWLTFNCEHFVRHAHGIPVESPQAQRAVFLGVTGLVVFN